MAGLLVGLLRAGWRWLWGVKRRPAESAPQGDTEWDEDWLRNTGVDEVERVSMPMHIARPLKFGLSWGKAVFIHELHQRYIYPDKQFNLVLSPQSFTMPR